MNNEKTTEQGHQFNFTFQVKDERLASFTHLKLFNGYNELVREGYGDMAVTLPKGLYQLRIEMNEHVEDRSYRVTEDISDSLVEIQTVSAMPVIGLPSTHEYFSVPSAEWSERSTLTNEPIHGSCLFLFLRYADAHKPFGDAKDRVKGFFILNEQREVIFTLDEHNTKSESGQHIEYFGCIGFHERVPAGQYYLLYQQEQNCKEMPVYVFESWKSQVFMMLADGPVFASTRISIEAGRFSWQNPENMQLDALIQKMYNRIYFLPDDLRQAAVEGKWTNPMLGIVASYMYLMTANREDDKLFATILDNLEQNILFNKTAPDLIALRLLGAVHFKKDIPQTALTAPCMIAAGMDVFLSQSFHNEGLIQKGSIAEQVFENRKGDSIWTTYDPLPVKERRTGVPGSGIEVLPVPRVGDADAAYTEYEGAEEGSGADGYTENGDNGQEAGNEADEFRNKGGTYYEPQKNVAPEFVPKQDWVSTSLFSQLLESKSSLDIPALAAQLQVPGNTVKLALYKLSNPAQLDAAAGAALDADLEQQQIDKAVKTVGDKIKRMRY